MIEQCADASYVLDVMQVIDVKCDMDFKDVMDVLETNNGKCVLCIMVLNSVQVSALQLSGGTVACERCHLGHHGGNFCFSSRRPTMDVQAGPGCA